MDHQQLEQEEQQQPTVMASTGSVVTFHTKIKVVEVPGLSFYTDEDHDAVWYDANEYEQIALNRQRCFQRGDDLHQDESLTQDEKDAAWIGTCTWEESEERKQRIYDSRIAVFREQQLQWDENIVDDELLADIYFESTIQGQIVAMNRGEQLAKEEELVRQKKQVSMRRKKSSSSKRRKSIGASTTATKKIVAKLHKNNKNSRSARNEVFVA